MQLLKKGLKHMTTQNVIISPLILSHYPKAVLLLYEICEDRKDRDSYTAKLALGVSAQQPGRVFDRDSSTLSPPSPATVQDQRFGKIAGLWHHFLNFLPNHVGGRMKAGSCVILKRPRACWISFTDGSVSSADCCSHRWRKQEGETAEAFAPSFQNSKQFRQLRFQRVCQCHLDTEHPVFVYPVCVHACCVSDLTPCQCSAVFTREEEKFEKQKYRKPNSQM